MTEVKNKLYFVPLRRVYGCEKTYTILNSPLEQGLEGLKDSKYYFPNFLELKEENKEGLEKRNVFELEHEYFERLNKPCSVHKRRREEVLNCHYRCLKKDGIFYCNGVDEEVSYKGCIIQESRLEFNLPKDCPYLQKESDYVTLRE